MASHHWYFKSAVDMRARPRAWDFFAEGKISLSAEKLADYPRETPEPGETRMYAIAALGGNVVSAGSKEPHIMVLYVTRTGRGALERLYRAKRTESGYSLRDGSDFKAVIAESEDVPLPADDEKIGWHRKLLDELHGVKTHSVAAVTA